MTDLVALEGPNPVAILPVPDHGVPILAGANQEVPIWRHWTVGKGAREFTKEGRGLLESMAPQIFQNNTAKGRGV